MKKRESPSLNIARIIIAFAVALAPVMLLLASTPLLDLPSPIDVLCLMATLSWFVALFAVQRLFDIYLRGFELMARSGEALARDIYRFGQGAILFSGDLHIVSSAARRACNSKQSD